LILGRLWPGSLFDQSPAMCSIHRFISLLSTSSSGSSRYSNWHQMAILNVDTGTRLTGLQSVIPVFWCQATEPWKTLVSIFSGELILHNFSQPG